LNGAEIAAILVSSEFRKSAIPDGIILVFKLKATQNLPASRSRPVGAFWRR